MTLLLRGVYGVRGIPSVRGIPGVQRYAMGPVRRKLLEEIYALLAQVDPKSPEYTRLAHHWKMLA